MMNARALGATKVFAWPDAQVAVMGAVAAIRILHRRRLAEVPEDARAQVELELAAEHEVISGGVARAIDHDHVSLPGVPAEERDPHQLLLGDEAAVRQPGELGEDVKHALVFRGDDSRALRHELDRKSVV